MIATACSPQHFARSTKRLAARAFCAAALALGALAAPFACAAPRFIPTFIVYYGGGPSLTAADVPKLARYDLIDIDRFRYADIGGDTWAAIKAANPAAQIYLYEMGPEAPNHHDATAPLFLNGLGRYNVARSHPMGSLNGNQPGLFLLNASGARVYSVVFSNVAANQYWHLMDFGSSAYHSYWVSSVKADIIDQPWRADGVFADNCLTLAAAGGYSATPARYSSNTSWSNAMNSFTAAIATGLRVHGQKLWCNRGESRSAEGAAAWLALDATPAAPDVVLDEGAFAVQWGADTQFYPEAEWKRQVDTIAAITRSKVALMSHTSLDDGASGVDNWGRPVTFRQSLWYAMGSFLLAKNDTLDNTYFMFNGPSGYNRLWWFDEYDRIDLGRSMGPYQVRSIAGVNVYWREFERGYVYVNPTPSDVVAVTLPQSVRQITHANLFSPLESLPLVSSVPLAAHHVAILAKATGAPTPDTAPPSVPIGLSAAVASATQVNLTWNPASDNVAVTGYHVYLNDVVLATTAATSFQHSGVAAGGTYRYRVSAHDAVPNHSAWTGVVTVSTPAATDTTPPSVPTGLSASAASGTQVNLGWNAASDNVGVTGYHVYLNDVMLATTTAISFQHTGLAAGTSYRYRVSAHDAVPNHSAWTAAVTVTTPAAPQDTTPPSVPTGLRATAVSQTQVSLSWNPSTDNVGVTGYWVFANNKLLAMTSTTSFTRSDSPGTSWRYHVKAVDARGNLSAASASLRVATLPGADTTPPAVAIATPTAGATVAGNITVSANVSDDRGVAGVQFKYGGVNLGAEVTAPPYRVTAYTASVPNGEYALTAVARDAAGNVATSAPVSVRVAN